jgi:hypothetical protein
MHSTRYLRRPQAADYLKAHFGFGAVRTLAKLATLGGGPVYRKLGRIVIYDPADLDAWALSRMSAPVRSTSEEKCLREAAYQGNDTLVRKHVKDGVLCCSKQSTL